MKGRLVLLGKWFLSACLAVAATLVFAVLLILNTEPGTRWLLAQAAQRLAVVEGLSIAFETADGTLLYGLSLGQLTVEVEGDGSHVRIDLGSLDLQWSPLRLLDSELSVQYLSLDDLRVTVTTLEAESDPADVEGALTQMFSVPLAVDVARMEVNGLELNLDGQETTLAAIEAAIELNSQQLGFREVSIRHDAYELGGELQLAADSLAIEGRLQWQVNSADTQLSGSADISGDLENLNVMHQLSSPLVVNSSGTVMPGLLNGTVPQFRFRHEFADASSVIPSLQAVESLEGVVNTEGTAEDVSIAGEILLTLENLEPFVLSIDAAYENSELMIMGLGISNSLLEFQSSGLLTLQEDVNLELEWALSRLDINAYLSGLSLDEVTGRGGISLVAGSTGVRTSIRLDTLSGNLNAYPLDASGQLSLLDEAVESVDLAFRAGENILQLEGSFDRQLDFSWTIDAPALDVLLADLSGSLNGNGTLSGTLQAPEINGNVAGSSLSYRQADGEYSLQQFGLEASHADAGNIISLHAESIRFPLSGADYRINQAELQVNGEAARHEVSLNAIADEETLQLQAQGGFEEGTWNGQISGISITSDFGNWQQMDAATLTVSATAISISSHCWGFAGITLCGGGNWASGTGYTASLELASFPLAFLNLPGTVTRVNETEILERLAAKPAGLTRLQQRFGVVLPANAFIDGSMRVTAGISGGTEGFEDLQLSLLPEDLRLGLLIEQESESQTLAPEVEDFEFDDAHIGLGGSSGDWIADASFSVYQRQDSGLDLQGRFFGEVGLDDEGNLTGFLNFDFTDIAWMETVIPQIRNGTGSVHAEANISGNRTRPLFLADLEISDAGFELPAQGIRIRNLNALLHSDVENEMTLSGSAESGDGALQFDSRISTPFLPSRNLNLSFRGENFQVMNIPEIRVAVNPDVELTFSQDRLDIRGMIEVPEFDLNLEDSQRISNGGGVNVSQDVVIVAAPEDRQELLTENDGSEVLRRVPVTGEVTLTLGDEVRFRGFGLDALLEGSLSIVQTPDRPVLAYGEVSIAEGSYEAYGQRLNAEGKLIFFGNPANPALDMRAYRETPGTIAGVQMNGTLRNIQGQLYSTPALPESEILAILITGKSFNNINNQDGDSLLGAIAGLGIERGQGLTNTVRNKLGLDTVEVTGGSTLNESSLGLGKYITPDLFMRYDIGLFEKQSALTLAYSLSERFKLQVETGISQSVDLTYTVEK